MSPESAVIFLNPDKQKRRNHLNPFSWKLRLSIDELENKAAAWTGVL